MGLAKPLGLPLLLFKYAPVLLLLLGDRWGKAKIPF